MLLLIIMIKNTDLPSVSGELSFDDDPTRCGSADSSPVHDVSEGVYRGRDVFSLPRPLGGPHPEKGRQGAGWKIKNLTAKKKKINVRPKNRRRLEA